MGRERTPVRTQSGGVQVLRPIIALVIDVAHLSKRYGDTLAVDDLSFHLAPWTGFAVFAGYAALAVAGAAFGLLRRDA